MKRITAILGSVLMLCSFGLAQAKDEKKTISQVVDSAAKRLEGDFLPAAEAMPGEKYAFAPTNGEFKGVRTFAEQIKHVAATNYLVAALILGEKPPVDVNDGKGPDSVKSKAEILKFLKDSFAYAHKAVATITDANAVEPTRTRQSQPLPKQMLWNRFPLSTANQRPRDSAWVCCSHGMGTITTDKWWNICA